MSEWFRTQLEKQLSCAMESKFTYKPVWSSNNKYLWNHTKILFNHVHFYFHVLLSAPFPHHAGHSVYCSGNLQLKWEQISSLCCFFCSSCCDFFNKNPREEHTIFLVAGYHLLDVQVSLNATLKTVLKFSFSIGFHMWHSSEGDFVCHQFFIPIITQSIKHAQRARVMLHSGPIRVTVITSFSSYMTTGKVCRDFSYFLLWTLKLTDASCHSKSDQSINQSISQSNSWSNVLEGKVNADTGNIRIWSFNWTLGQMLRWILAVPVREGGAFESDRKSKFCLVRVPYRLSCSSREVSVGSSAARWIINGSLWL